MHADNVSSTVMSPTASADAQSKLQRLLPRQKSPLSMVSGSCNLPRGQMHRLRFMQPGCSNQAPQAAIRPRAALPVRMPCGRLILRRCAGTDLLELLLQQTAAGQGAKPARPGSPSREEALHDEETLEERGMEDSDALSGKHSEEASLQRQLDVDFTSVSAQPGR